MRQIDQLIAQVQPAMDAILVDMDASPIFQTRKNLMDKIMKSTLGVSKVQAAQMVSVMDIKVSESQDVDKVVEFLNLAYELGVKMCRGLCGEWNEQIILETCRGFSIDC